MFCDLFALGGNEVLIIDGDGFLQFEFVENWVMNDKSLTSFGLISKTRELDEFFLKFLDNLSKFRPVSRILDEFLKLRRVS